MSAVSACPRARLLGELEEVRVEPSVDGRGHLHQVGNLLQEVASGGLRDAAAARPGEVLRRLPDGRAARCHVRDDAAVLLWGEEGDGLGGREVSLPKGGCFSALLRA